MRGSLWVMRHTHTHRFSKKKTFSRPFPTFITSPLLSFAVFRLLSFFFLSFLLSFFLSLYLYLILIFLAISFLLTYKFIVFLFLCLILFFLVTFSLFASSFASLLCPFFYFCTGRHSTFLCVSDRASL